MNLLTPNKALQRTRLLRLGFAMSLRFAQRPGGRVAELGRSAASNAGGVEQEPTEGTETDSILCFLCCLLLNSEAGCLASVDADFFSCVSRGWRVDWIHSHPGRVTGRHCVFAESEG